MIEVWSGGSEEQGNTGVRHIRSTENGGEAGGARVLVVDDDPSILDTVTAILTGEGYLVKAAGGGEEALALLDAWRPTLVLLDMRMPFMDGWAVARAMREKGSEVPIVVMTAAENARRWADEIAAAGHLAKPFDLDDLLDIVERHGTKGRPN